MIKSQWVNLKCGSTNISKTANRRAKQMKISDLESYGAYVVVTFGTGFFEFSLGSFSALCKISNFRIFKTLLQTLCKVS